MPSTRSTRRYGPTPFVIGGTIFTVAWCVIASVALGLVPQADGVAQDVPTLDAADRTLARASR